MFNNKIFAEIIFWGYLATVVPRAVFSLLLIKMLNEQESPLTVWFASYNQNKQYRER